MKLSRRQDCGPGASNAIMLRYLTIGKIRSFQCPRSPHSTASPSSTAATSSTSTSAATSSRPTLTATWPNGRGGRRSTCSARGPPQVVVGRYADVHQVFSDTETFDSEMPQRSGLGAVPQVHGRAVRHADGRRAACPPSPPADAGVLVAADRAAAGQHHDDHRWHARPDRGERAEVRRHAGPRRASRGGCAARSDDPDGCPAQSDVRRVSRCAAGDHLHQARRAVPGRMPARHAARDGRDQGHHRGAARRRRIPTSSAIWSTPATPATSSPTRSCSIRFSVWPAARCRPPAARPAARSICSTPTTTSASS